MSNLTIYRISLSIAFFYQLLISGCYKEKTPELLESAFFDTGSVNYTNYSSVASADKILVYNETFNTGAGAWWTGSQDKLEASVASGHYSLSNKDASLWRWLNRDVSLDATQNFELEVMVKVDYTYNNDGAGMALTNADGDVMTLLLDANDQLSMYSYVDASNQKSEHKAWTQYAWLETSEWTLLTIRKGGDRYYFYVNEQNIGVVLPASTIAPDKIALFLDGYAGMQVDRITFSYF